MAEIKQIRVGRFCNRTDALMNWVTYNPILLNGELGIIQGGLNGQTVLLVGDGVTNVNTILENYSDYNDNIIFCGQGAQYDLPPAGIDLGGVKKGDETETGIKIEDGIVSNLLVDDYDMLEDCYVINKVHIRHLIADREEEIPVFESSSITLRYLDPAGVEAPEPLADGSYAGITIMNTKELEDGTLIPTQIVVDNSEQLYVSRNEELKPVLTMSQLLPLDKPSLLTINSETGLGSLADVQPLTFTSPYISQRFVDPITGEESIVEGLVTYTGLNATTIDLTPPQITVNSQPMTYDANTNTYAITLDGGLTEDNAERIAKIDVLEASFASLDKTVTDSLAAVDDKIADKLSVSDLSIEASEKITVIQDPGLPSFSIGHDLTTTTTETGQAQVIKIDQNSFYTFVVGIDVDSYGHVTKIHKQTYKFET